MASLKLKKAAPRGWIYRKAELAVSRLKLHDSIKKIPKKLYLKPIAIPPVVEFQIRRAMREAPMSEERVLTIEKSVYDLERIEWSARNITRIKMPAGILKYIPMWKRGEEVMDEEGDYQDGFERWLNLMVESRSILGKLAEAGKSEDSVLQECGLRFVEVYPVTLTTMVSCPICETTFEMSKETVDSLKCCPHLFCKNCLYRRVMGTSGAGTCPPKCFCGATPKQVTRTLGSVTDIAKDVYPTEHGYIDVYGERYMKEGEVKFVDND